MRYARMSYLSVDRILPLAVLSITPSLLPPASQGAVPVTRRVYAADTDHRKVAEPLPGSIDLRDVPFDTV